MIKVITYHYVRPDSKEFPDLKFITLDCFRKQLDYFNKEYGFISQRSFKESLQKKQIVESGVLLTFDDGLNDHYQWVYPELLERGLWGIFFISTGQYYNQQLLGVHRIHALLSTFNPSMILEESLSLIDDSMLDNNHIEKFDEYIYGDQKNLDTVFKVKRLFNYFLNYNYRDIILNILMKKLFDEQDLCKRYYLTKDQIRKMQNSNMWFGGHTDSHNILSRLDVMEQNKEIVRAFEFLEQNIGISNPRTFSYPYGNPSSYNKDTIDILIKKNVLCAFDFDLTDNRDINDNDLKNPFTLPRFDCNRFYELAC